MGGSEGAQCGKSGISLSRKELERNEIIDVEA